MDRYFHYFLLFVTTPLVALGVILSGKSAAINPLFISMSCVLLSGIGFSFYAMYVKQRVNSIKAVRELQYLERLLKEERENMDENPLIAPFQQNVETKSQNLFSNRGADFWVSVIQGLISSFWFASGVYLAFQNIGDFHFCGLNSKQYSIITLIVITIGMTLLALKKGRTWLKDYEV